MRKLVIGVAAFLFVGIVAVLVGEINLRFAPADAQDKRDDVPLGFFIGLLTDESDEPIFFTEVSGLGSENEVIEHKVVGRKGTQIVKKLPGRLKWQDITLKRGLTSDLELWEWRKSVEDGNLPLKNGSIIMFGPDSPEPIAKWNFTNAWPSKITGPTFKSDDNSFGTEEVTLTHEHLERVKP